LLRSSDGTVWPKIVPNYLSDPIDKQSVVDQLKIIRKIWQQPALQPYLKAPGDPFGELAANPNVPPEVQHRGRARTAVGLTDVGDHDVPPRFCA